MAASEAKLGMVSCRLQHQKETRTRGAASPRSASPIGPAPTRLPRMALPLLTAHPLLHDPLNPGVRDEICRPDRHRRQRLSSKPSPTMQTNHRIPVKIVIRSRFLSTTDDDPRLDETPPPNRSDSPPPLPLWSSTSKIISRLVMIKTIEIAMVTAAFRPLRAAAQVLALSSRYRHILTNSP